MTYTVEYEGMIPSDNEAFAEFESDYFVRTLDNSGTTWVFEIDDEIAQEKGQAINDFLDSRPCVKSYFCE